MKIKVKYIVVFILAFAMILSTSACKNPFKKEQSTSSCENSSNEEQTYAKPVIYLYPEETMDVTVKLKFKGSLSCTWPQFDNKTGGWQVTAHPDGSLINKADGQEYSYLFWEGEANAEYDFSSGFVVSGEDTAEFLREKLAFMGLIPKEYNEFIVY
ncbi:MAG: hypothetical protein LBS74_07920 [Oscillospiraceae bacterium]|nr:hypothetical protein [Oscillospiraceae bacterium]